MTIFSQSTPDTASLLALISFSNRCGTPPNTPPFEAQRLYWHTASCLPPSRNNLLVSGFNTICNGPDLVDIVFFGLSLSSFRSKILKHVCQREIYTTLFVSIIKRNKLKESKKEKIVIRQGLDSNLGNEWDPKYISKLYSLLRSIFIPFD